jgi:hypothetical protein
LNRGNLARVICQRFQDIFEEEAQSATPLCLRKKAETEKRNKFEQADRRTYGGDDDDESTLQTVTTDGRYGVKHHTHLFLEGLRYDPDLGCYRVVVAA